MALLLSASSRSKARTWESKSSFFCILWTLILSHPATSKNLQVDSWHLQHSASYNYNLRNLTFSAMTWSLSRHLIPRSIKDQPAATITFEQCPHPRVQHHTTIHQRHPTLRSYKVIQCSTTLPLKPVRPTKSEWGSRCQCQHSLREWPRRVHKQALHTRVLLFFILNTSRQGSGVRRLGFEDFFMAPA